MTLLPYYYFKGFLSESPEREKLSEKKAGEKTDSYKTSHSTLYPLASQMVAYGEFRTSLANPTVGGKAEERLVFYGLRYIIETHLGQMTEQDVELASQFYSTHGIANRGYPFPRDLFLKVVREHNGYWPITIEALDEASIIYPHVPVYQITAQGEFSRLVTYLETLLTMVWYPSTVATLSRKIKSVIETAYVESVDPAGFLTLGSRLHDFGFRGCTSVEQSIIGGCAHLLNFEGTDTGSAAFYAQYHLNGGKPVGTSVVGTEHSVMTAHKNEREAMVTLLNQFGAGVCACVMDSYDYTAALDKLLPSIAQLKLEKGGMLVLRPDSGDPVQVVLQALQAADKTFGHSVNSKGYKILNGVGVIQGDGINMSSLQAILDAVLKAGYSAQNVAFGMGGGLLQKVNRDSMSFATKLSKIVYADGTERDVMKMPKGDTGKTSLPGKLKVIRNAQNIPMVYPFETPVQGENLLKVVYDHGPVAKWEKFDALKKRVQKQWHESPPTADVISDELKAKIESVKRAQAIASQL